MRRTVTNPRHTDFPEITVSRIITSHMEKSEFPFLFLFSLLVFGHMCVRGPFGSK